MKIASLAARVDRMPMLKILFPFAVGVAAAEFGTLPLWFLAGAFVVCGGAALLLRSSAWTVGLLAVVGFSTAQVRTPLRPTVPRNVPTAYEITVEEIPSDRGRSTTVEAVVTAWRNPEKGCWHPSEARIMLRCDSLTRVDAGQRLRCRGVIRPFTTGAESYQRLMRRRGFAGTLWISERTLLERLPERGATWHEAATARLERLPMRAASGAVVRAMAVGDRSTISPELRATYARSGLSHLLAVSGLHTGIVFALVNLMLWWLPVLRRGHLWRNLLVIAAVWCYVAVAGFPPSAVRAAVMCTLLQTALATASEYVGMNGWAAAALGMLLWNPAWIGDIGVQLSFVAVGAILAWSMPLCRRLRTRSRWVNGLIGAYVVCVVATVATWPLVSHAFGIVPLAGILISPVAIALATVVVACGVVWVVMPFGAVAPLVGGVADWSAAGITQLAEWTAEMPFGVVEYRLDGGLTGAIYLLFGVATLAMWCREPKKSVHLRT